MCGIVGYIGGRDCADVLMDGLEKLEYRGYDSAGIAERPEPGWYYQHSQDARQTEMYGG